MEIINWANKAYLYVSSIFSTELTSALIGAVIGGMFTSRATRKAHDLESDRKKEDGLHTTANMLKLIRVELNAAWSIYEKEYAEDLRKLPAGTPHLFTLPIGQNPFPVFDSSPLHLVEIPPELSAKIVRIYMRMKGLVQMIEDNNRECAACADHARLEWQKAFEEARAGNYQVAQQKQNEVNAIYDRELRTFAAMLGMGTSADRLKSLTNELEPLLIEINQDIETLLPPSSR